ncbi:MAG: hypothetical protein KKB76_02100, partial [Candidatus Omnitrophica bacterium]|nr:hypothetical protein [Candidatus Omnitrophota bacterium]
MTDNLSNPTFEELQREIGWEFDKFILANTDFADSIPLGAQVIFLLEDNHEFNEWSKKVNEIQREPNQPVAYVKIKKLMPPQISRL